MPRLSVSNLVPLACFVALCLLSNAALAQSCSGSTWTLLTNGNPADASQVMSNFNCVLNSPNFSGNVAIGTTSPAVPLHVNGQTFIRSVASGSPQDVLTLNVTGPNYAQFYDVSQTGSAGGVALGGTSTITAIPSSAIMFWNTNTGNVGVGTTSPAVPLHVNGQTFIRSVSSGSPQDVLTLNVTGPNYAQFYDVSQTGSAGGLAVGGANAITGVPSSAIMFWNTNTGNVGIGTSTPNFAAYGAGGTVLSIYGTGQPGAILELVGGTSVADGNVASDVAFENANLITTKRLALIRATMKGAASNDAGGQIDILTKLNGGNLADVMTITNAGKVGIGTASPAQALEVNGQVRVDTLASASMTNLCITATSNGVIATCSSSIRYKENVKAADFGLKEVLAMRPVTFKWKGRNEQDFGLIAEEVAKIDSRYVTYKAGRIEGVKYPQLTAVLINAVKQLKAANDAQAAAAAVQIDEMTRLSAQNQVMQRRLQQQTVEMQQVRSKLNTLERRLVVRVAQTAATAPRNTR
jgi:hypothetical protein